MPKKDRTLPREVAEAAASLRVAGMSERSIYERFRSLLAKPPSYRDLRATFDTYGVGTRAQATARRHAKEFPEQTRELERPVKSSAYQARRRNNHEVYPSGDDRAKADRLLDNQYAVGYLARAGLPAAALSDSDEADFFDDIYDGFGS